VRDDIDAVRRALNEICQITARIVRAEITCVVHCSAKNAIIRAAVGTNVSKLGSHKSLPQMDALKKPYVIHANLVNQKWFSTHPICTIAPSAKALAAICVTSKLFPDELYLLAFNPSLQLAHQVATVAMLSNLAEIAGALLDACDVGTNTRHADPKHNAISLQNFSESQLDSVTPLPENQETVLTFLLKTLIPHRLLHSRKDTAFVAVRRWRKPIKDAQVSAMQSLKLCPSPAAVEAMAKEICDVVGELHGFSAFSAVVPVPGGSSGMEKCLSVLLAEKVASKMGVPCQNCLMGQGTPGASHPRKSKNLGLFKSRAPINGHVLIIDDVTTTGTHLEMATKTIRALGATASAIAWIGN
jgi:hypothetical protein